MPPPITKIRRRMSMRCLQCNKLLTDEESVHKDKHGANTDTCFACMYGDSPGEDDSLEDDFYDDAIAQADLFMDR